MGGRVEQPAGEVKLRGSGPLVGRREPNGLEPSRAEHAGPQIEIRWFGLSASRTNDSAQNEEHDRHSKQEAKVVLAAVVVHFVHLPTLVDE